MIETLVRVTTMGFVFGCVGWVGFDTIRSIVKARRQVDRIIEEEDNA